MFIRFLAVTAILMLTTTVASGQVVLNMPAAAKTQTVVPQSSTVTEGNLALRRYAGYRTGTFNTYGSYNRSGRSRYGYGYGYRYGSWYGWPGCGTFPVFVSPSHKTHTHNFFNPRFTWSIRIK